MREGEELAAEFLLKLFRKQRVCGSEGVYVLHEERGIQGPKSTRISRKIPLDEYPMPALSIDLLKLDGYSRWINANGEDSGVTASIFTSRGCPFSCRFCASHAVFGKRTELRSAEKVFEEMKYYYDRGFRAFYVVDDNFCFKKQRILDLARLITESGMADIEYLIMTRAEFIDDDVAVALKQCGCKVVAIGVESGDQRLLNVEAHKNIKLTDVENATRILKKAGVYVKYFLMVGLPGQDWASIEKTALFILENVPDAVNVSVAVPYPGSDYSLSGEIKVDDGVTTDQFVHEPEPKLKGKIALDIVTRTDVMPSKEIALARDLLMHLFKVRNQPDKVREILQMIGRLRDLAVISKVRENIRSQVLSEGYNPVDADLILKDAKDALDLIAEKIKTGKLTLGAKVRTSFSEKDMPIADRSPKRVGMLAVTGDPMHWGHIIGALKAIGEHNLSQVVFVISGPDARKPVLADTQLDRISMARILMPLFEGLFSYSNISIEDPADGETQIWKLMQLNNDIPLTMVYLVGDDHQYYYSPKSVKANPNDPSKWDLDTIGKFHKNFKERGPRLGAGQKVEILFFERERKGYMPEEQEAIGRACKDFMFGTIKSMNFDASSSEIRKALSRGDTRNLTIIPRVLVEYINAHPAYRKILENEDVGTARQDVEGTENVGRLADPIGLRGMPEREIEGAA